MTDIVVVQHDQTTDLYHPALYRLAPFPGGHDRTGVIRYRSVMHHTGGFKAAYDADQSAAELAEKCGITGLRRPFSVIEMEAAGADTLLARSEDFARLFEEVSS
jgi:hypothetical protein